MGGKELEPAAPVLSFVDRGFGERNLANTFLRLNSGFNEETLGWFDIIAEMEVEKEDEACCSRCGFGITSKQKSRFSIIPTSTQVRLAQGLHFLAPRSINQDFGSPEPKVHYEAIEESASFMSRRPRPSLRPNLRNPRDGQLLNHQPCGARSLGR
jgi:hypothetical protein